MASCGEAQVSRKKEVPAILRNKNLYLGFSWNSKILGIRIEPSGDDIGSLEEEKPDIIENPVILGKWDIHRDYGLPIGMGIHMIDSKLYMIGGKKMPKGCFSESSLSELVYEFAVPELDFTKFITSSPVPPLPTPMPAPTIIEHLGEIYVLYREDMYTPNWRYNLRGTSWMENRFLVLRNTNGCMEWESLPAPPVFHKVRSRLMRYIGGAGSRMYVMIGGIVFCYDINKREWEEKSDCIYKGRESLTLSSLSVPTRDAEGRPSYVVIYALSGEVEHKLEAALIDGDGELLDCQVIHVARGQYDYLGDIKLIELQESEEEKDPYNSSSIFALVFAPDATVVGLTVIKVTLLHSVSKVEHHKEKQHKLSGADDDFLKVEILLNQRYITEGEFGHNVVLMNDAFFC